MLRGDGQLIVQGRRDDMIVLNGLNIFPAEIERVLERHPAVAEAAALPLASPVHGQIPVAAVVLRPGRGHRGQRAAPLLPPAVWGCAPRAGCSSCEPVAQEQPGQDR